MVTANDTKITNDEASLYDRQIRLWGVAAQNRLRNSSVLLIGLNLTGAEIAKNLILAGIKKLDIIDPRPITDLNEQCHFLIPHAETVLNQKASTAALPQCRALNPLVEISDLSSVDPFEELVEKSSEGEKNEEETTHVDQQQQQQKDHHAKTTTNFFSKYDLVCLIDWDRTKIDLEKIVALNRVCRNSNVKFVSAGNFGFFAYTFFDFINFEYFQETVKSEAKKNEENNDEGPEVKKAKLTEASDSSKPVKLVEKFVPFDLAASSKLRINRQNAKKFKKLPGGFYQFHLLNRFCEKTRENPPNNQNNNNNNNSLNRDEEESVRTLHSLYDELITEVSTSINDLTFEIRRFSPEKLCGTISPVCAIIGGIASQQIIQALSQNEQPINNFVFYDGYDCTACKLPVE